MGGQLSGTTVVVAQPDPAGRELLARIAEASGHNAVRLDADEPPALVDATVDASAQVLVLDLATVGRSGLEAVVQAFATRRYPAGVVAVVDGPVGADLAAAAGARQVLCRPFHRDDLVTALAAVIDGAGADPDAEAAPSAVPVLPSPEVPALVVPPVEESPSGTDAPDPVEDRPPADATDEGADGVATEVAMPGDFTDILRMGRQL